MKSEERNKGVGVLVAYLLFIAVLGIVSIIFREQLGMIYEDPAAVKEFIDSTGMFAPVVLILMQTFQVIIFMIPGPVMTIAGGYAFGIWKGFIYSFIGTLLGSIVVFMLARKFGRPFVERVLGKDGLKISEPVFQKKMRISLLVTRTMPILFPNDAVSFVAGLTSLRLSEYIIISFFGFIPNILLLTVFGKTLYENMNPAFLLTAAFIGFALLAFIWRKNIIKVFRKLREYKKRSTR